MKHLLNDLSQEEKNSILEQHKGGMKIFNENFNKMVNKKLGHAELYEQTEKTDDSSIYSTKKISELSDEDKNKLRNSDSNVWSSLIGPNRTFGDTTMEQGVLERLLSKLNLFVVNTALGMTSLPMDVAVERVLSRLPVYFKDNTYVKNIELGDPKTFSFVQKIINNDKGLELVKRVALKNYNDNKGRTGIS